MSSEEYYQTPQPPLHQPHSAPLPAVPTDTPAASVKKLPEDPAQAAMHKLLGARVRCTLSDGRTATGAFICLDRLKNMILMDVIEERVINRADYSADATPKEFLVQRELAQAMIPGKHLVKVEIEKEVFEARMKERKEGGDVKVATAAALAL